MSARVNELREDKTAPVVDSGAEEGLTKDTLNPDQFIDGRKNIKEALGFIKDWVTAVVAIETASIGAIGVLLKVQERPPVLTIAQFISIYISLVCFLISIFAGMSVLHMLPGCAQRFPRERKDDVYQLTTAGRRWPNKAWDKGPKLNVWTTWFWWPFVGGLFAFVVFVFVHTLEI
jgi:hypothetical protein